MVNFIASHQPILLTGIWCLASVRWHAVGLLGVMFFGLLSLKTWVWLQCCECVRRQNHKAKITRTPAASASLLEICGIISPWTLKFPTLQKGSWEIYRRRVLWHKAGQYQTALLGENRATEGPAQRASVPNSRDLWTLRFEAHYWESTADVPWVYNTQRNCVCCEVRWGQRARLPGKIKIIQRKWVLGTLLKPIFS